MLIDGKVALVTGGAAGIGLALVRHLLELGASVASIDIASDALLRQQEREFGDRFGADRIMMIRADCGDMNALGAAFQAAVIAFGRIDICVNNAALPETGGDFHVTCQSKHVAEVLGVGLLGVTEGTRLAVHHMLARSVGRGGAIVNVSSMGGLLPMPFSVVYSAAKHGVVGLSRSLYHLADPRLGGVRVNCVNPSFVATAMVLENLELSQGFKKAVDVSKLIAPSAIVDAIVRLIEDEAAAGQVLRVLPDAGAVLQPYPAWHQMPTLPPLPGGSAHAAAATSGGSVKTTGGRGKGGGRPQAKL